MLLVSIVCAAYNCAKYLPDAIQSVQNQTISDWELLIIDDCSTDGTLELAQNYADKDDRIKVWKNDSNWGPAKTRNRGIESAKGSYLTFLDADDLWKDNFLHKSIEFLEEKDCVFCFASYHRVDENLKPLYNPFIVPTIVNHKELLKGCPIPCLTAFIDIGTIGKYYMPDIKKRQDYGLWLKILKDVDYAYGIKEPLATYRIRKNSVSRNKFKAMYYVWKLFREVEEINFFKSLYFISIYGYNGLKKYM
jgi:glycosyltransferase involved in cell wall biosynthesis